jgi:hypothetical protein
MRYEDERRRLFLSLQQDGNESPPHYSALDDGYNTTGSTPPGSGRFSTTDSRDRGSRSYNNTYNNTRTSSSNGNSSSSGNGSEVTPPPPPPPTALQLEGAFNALRGEQLVAVLDRVPKAFRVAVTLAASTSTSGTSRNFVDMFSSSAMFALEWREPEPSPSSGGGGGGDGSSSAVVGSVAVADMQEVYKGLLHDSNSVRSAGECCELTIIIGESVRALKASRGRTSITIKFESESECARFNHYLSVIRQFVSM